MIKIKENMRVLSEDSSEVYDIEIDEKYEVGDYYEKGKFLTESFANYLLEMGYAVKVKK